MKPKAPSHYRTYTDRGNWAPTNENIKGDSAILFTDVCFCTEKSGATIENGNEGKAGRCWWKERQAWGIWPMETRSMSGMYTMLPLTQVLRAGEKKENPGKKRQRWSALVVSHKTGAVTGDGE